MISFYITGLAVTIALCIVNVVTFFLTGDNFLYIFMFIVCAFPFIISKEQTGKWNSNVIFKINPEIFFILVCFLGSLSGDYWMFYQAVAYQDYGLRYFLSSGLGTFFFGLILWYMAVKFHQIITFEKAEFFKRSWLYMFWQYLKKRKEARVLEKRRSEFREFLGVIHEMAEGNIDVELPEKLGAYEDFRPDLIKIRAGIKDAVTREVKSERMKMELVSNVSHDLKTPLTAMITYIDLLKDEKLSEGKKEEYLDIISTRADRLKHLIEDLFEVTKATTGNVTFEPVEMDIANLLRQVVFEYEDKFSENGIEVVMEIPEGKKMILADSQKTYRVYANLFGNAAKYSLHNSRLYVQVQETEEDICIIMKNVSATRLSVNGSELTERFVRGDSSRNTEGSGLGLAIAKSFTELQGGSLDILVDGDLFKAVTVWKKVK